MIVASERVRELEAINLEQQGQIQDRTGSVAVHEAQIEELRRMLAEEQSAMARKDGTIAALQQRITEADGKTVDLESQMEALQVMFSSVSAFRAQHLQI